MAAIATKPKIMIERITRLQVERGSEVAFANLGGVYWLGELRQLAQAK